MSVLGKRIKEERLKLGLTQTELGNKCGITKYTISLYENGKSTPNDDIKKTMSEIFNVSIDYLIGNSDIRNYDEIDRVIDEQRHKKAQSLKDELIELMIRRGIINNREDINDEHLNLIEMSIKTYADKTNNIKKGED